MLFLASWAVMMGPVTYGKQAFYLNVVPPHPLSLKSTTSLTHNTPVQHLTSGPRLPFTAAYFGSIALTLYFALGVSRHFPSLSSIDECSCTLVVQTCSHRGPWQSMFPISLALVATLATTTLCQSSPKQHCTPTLAGRSLNRRASNHHGLDRRVEDLR